MVTLGECGGAVHAPWPVALGGRSSRAFQTPCTAASAGCSVRFLPRTVQIDDCPPDLPAHLTCEILLQTLCPSSMPTIPPSPNLSNTLRVPSCPLLTDPFSGPPTARSRRTLITLDLELFSGCNP